MANTYMMADKERAKREEEDKTFLEPKHGQPIWHVMEQSWLHKKENPFWRKGRQLLAGMRGSSLGCELSTDNFSFAFPF